MSSNNTIKISAAGSGKTWDICHDALMRVKNKNQKVLITTYTNRGAMSIRTELKKQNGGVLHPLIVIKTWYEFLLSETIKPYQAYIAGQGRENKIKGYDFSETYGTINYGKTGTKKRYIKSGGNVKSNWASEFSCCLNAFSSGKVIKRLERIYSAIYFDEIQDLAGYDIEFIKLLLDSDIAITCCGDNKQATFSTNNALKNKKKTGKNIWVFFKELSDVGLVEIQHNLSSRRFNSDICAFANAIFPIGDRIATVMTDSTEHDGVFIIKKSDVKIYYDYFSPQVLKYDANTKTDNYQTANFGACKGETFDRVLIFPNGPLSNFVLKGKKLFSPEKYYVAVTRPKYSIAIVVDKLPPKVSNFKSATIELGEETIAALKFVY